MIKIYTRPGCAYCPTVKRICDSKGAKYQELPAEGPEYEAASKGYGYNVPLVTNGKTTMMGLNMGTLAQIISEDQEGENG
jgi:glutaredoxin